MSQVTKRKRRKLLTRIERRMKRLGQGMQHAIYRLQGRDVVHFLHIRKTGGTAFKDAIEQSPTMTDKYVIYLHFHGTRLNNVPQGEKVVFFLRDPVSRFVSGFYCRQRQGQPRYDSPWSADEKVAFEIFTTPNQLGLALSSPDPGEREKARWAMGAIEHVNSSYWDWFHDERYFETRAPDIFYVGHQHTLKQDFLTLKDKLGLPDSVVLPDDDVRAHRNPNSVDRKLDDTAIANLKEWYKREYDFLALCEKLTPIGASASKA